MIGMGIVFSVLFYQLYEKATAPPKVSANGGKHDNQKNQKVELKQGTQMSRMEIK